MKRLSVFIITHNEEKNIKACLESIKWADEIVVVDNDSNDNTIKICKEYTDRIFQEEWKGYAKQKQSALDKTTGEWVLNLDADERLTPELRLEIENTLAYKERLKDGYLIPFKSYFGGKWIKHGGWYPDYHLRLFRREKGRFGNEEVHEGVKIEGSIGYLKNPINHYTYNSISDFIKRMDLYTSLFAEDRYKKGKKAMWGQLVFRPPFTFFKMFFLQRGILDGYYGFLLAILYSYYTFLKYAKLREMWGP